MSGKVVGVVLLVVLLAGSLVFLQYRSSVPKSVNLTAHDMQLLFQELLPTEKQQEISRSPEEKKKFVDDIRKLLAVAQVAESEGYADRPEIQQQTNFQRDLVLYNAYKKKNPGARASDEEISQFHSSHPKEFDEFIQSNPRFAQQAQGPQREELRKQFGEFKVMAERARKDHLEKDDLTRLQIMLDRSQALAGAYMSEIQKDADKLVSDADVEQYFNEHASDFDEVRVRHILISTQPRQGGDDEDSEEPNDKKDKKQPEKPKTLTKDEARAKAQQILERVRKGEDFAKLAQEYTDDPGSKAQGGEIDFFGKGQMAPEFEKASFSLKPGEISDLVETQFGFHIIKVEERKAAQTPASDAKVKQRIVDKLKDQKLQDRIDEIAKSSNVVVPEDFDTTPKAAAAPAIPTRGAAEKE
jgi:peptidyl-prolyl cis-trans isomerase C